MKRKLFLTVLCALVCVFALCLVASAKEYTVTDSEGFKTAYASAADGDTIVIKADISGELDFGKSITYIIDGNYTWLAGGRVSEAGKAVNIYARGGNAVFKPNTGMWINSYEPDILADLKSTVWSFGALDKESTLSFDLTVANLRLMYGLTFKEINFHSGTIVENCNNVEVRDTRYFIATTINIYDGAIFRGIRVCPYRGFFECTTLNIYGGEIYGCYFTEYGMCVNVKAVNMYGGKIHDVYLNFSNTGVTEGLFNNSPLNMYGGEIYNNYVKISSAGAHSVLAGAKHLVGGSVHDNYTFTSWPSNPVLNENGLFELAELDVTTGTDAGYGKNATTVYDYSVVFKEANGKVISAYLVADGKLKSTVADATEVSVPTGYTFTDTFGSCKSTVVDIFVGGTFFAVSPHTYSANDFDCTTADTCAVCAYLTPAMSHDVAEEALFANGYGNKGAYKKYCKNEGCMACDEERELAAVIVSLGYSVSEKKTGFYSVAQGFVLGSESLELIGKLNGEKIVDFGVLVAVKGKLDGNFDVFENGELACSTGVISHSLASSKFDYIDVKLTGLEGENENGSFAEMEIFANAYLTLENGEERDTLYVDALGITDALAYSVTYNSFFNE